MFVASHARLMIQALRLWIEIPVGDGNAPQAQFPVLLCIKGVHTRMMSHVEGTNEAFQEPQIRELVHHRLKYIGQLAQPLACLSKQKLKWNSSWEAFLIRRTRALTRSCLDFTDGSSTVMKRRRINAIASMGILGSPRRPPPKSLNSSP